jgi:hypothetical protein
MGREFRRLGGYFLGYADGRQILCCGVYGAVMEGEREDLETIISRRREMTRDEKYIM